MSRPCGGDRKNKQTSESALFFLLLLFAVLFGAVGFLSTTRAVPQVRVFVPVKEAKGSRSTVVFTATGDTLPTTIAR